jgi:hypothetical protein
MNMRTALLRERSLEINIIQFTEPLDFQGQCTVPPHIEQGGAVGYGRRVTYDPTS